MNDIKALYVVKKDSLVEDSAILNEILTTADREAVSFNLGYKDICHYFFAIITCSVAGRGANSIAYKILNKACNGQAFKLYMKLYAKYVENGVNFISNGSLGLPMAVTSRARFALEFAAFNAQKHKLQYNSGTLLLALIEAGDPLLTDVLAQNEITVEFVREFLGITPTPSTSVKEDSPIVDEEDIEEEYYDDEYYYGDEEFDDDDEIIEDASSEVKLTRANSDLAEEKNVKSFMAASIVGGIMAAHNSRFMNETYMSEAYSIVEEIYSHYHKD